MMPNSIVTNVICLFCASINKFYLILSYLILIYSHNLIPPKFKIMDTRKTPSVANLGDPGSKFLTHPQGQTSVTRCLDE